MPDLKEISELIKGELKGNPQFRIDGINSLQAAGPTQITFSVKDDIDISKINAGALIVKKLSPLQYSNLIYVDEPYRAFALLLDYFYPPRRFNEGVDPHAIVAGTANIGRGVNIGPYSFVGEGCRIGDNTDIHANVCIYNDVKIGKDCLIYANVIIREDVEIGDNVIIQPGAVIGSDGFGFTRLSDGTPVKIPQKGKVIIGNHCEIGANTCIDRATIEETVLKDYVKLDNLIQIGHNCKIGKGTAISAQTGISGSVEVGENVIMGGQVGLADHIKIADGVMIVAQSGISGNIKTRSIVAGTPHQEIGKWRRNFAVFRNLEKYIDKIKELEKKIKELEEK